MTCHGGFRFNPVLVANCYALTRDVARSRSLGLAHNTIFMTVQLIGDLTMHKDMTGYATRLCTRHWVTQHNDDVHVTGLQDNRHTGTGYHNEHHVADENWRSCGIYQSCSSLGVYANLKKSVEEGRVKSGSSLFSTSASMSLVQCLCNC